MYKTVFYKNTIEKIGEGDTIGDIFEYNILRDSLKYKIFSRCCLTLQILIH